MNTLALSPRLAMIAAFTVIVSLAAILYADPPNKAENAKPAPLKKEDAPKIEPADPGAPGKTSRLGHSPKPKTVAPRQQHQKSDTADQPEASDNPDQAAKNKPASKPASPTKKQIEEAYLEELASHLTRLTLERDKLVAENSITDETLKKELAVRRHELERTKLALDEANQALEKATMRHREKIETEMAELRSEKELLVLEAEVAKAGADAEISRLKLLEEERKNRISELDSAIREKEKKVERNNYAEQEPVYLANPLQGNKLIVSDRRITLNGPIYEDTADALSERINYFNNKDKELPIFIVIDYSPGGSVMSGYKILKAMDGSQAPIFVVVKSFAASMAACITTLADQSFAYPNAIILHHQLSGGSYGNLTEQIESVEEAQEWWIRLAGPIADKMGISLEEFIKQMYRNASSGDWVEFADKAKELKWVDHIIDEIRETSLVKNPDAAKTPVITIKPAHYGLEEKVDEKGAVFVTLPRLQPFDYYWLYNPDGFYRSAR